MGTWIIVGALVSGWMFFLGVLVGRGDAPVRFDMKAIQQRLAAAKEAAFKKEVKRFQIPGEMEEGKADVGFYEALKESKESSGKLPMAGTAKQTIPNSAAEPKEKNIKPTELIETPPDLMKDKAGQGQEKPGQSEKDKGVSSINDLDKGLTIQIASFYNRTDAQRLVQELKDRGYPAYWTLGLVPGKGIWHRVRVGNFSTRDDAVKTAVQLKTERYNAVIVGKQTQ
ncbi:MAG: SPOR domain-containing protein [Thermodesulfobacteriota bacterium]